MKTVYLINQFKNKKPIPIGIFNTLEIAQEFIDLNTKDFEFNIHLKRYIKLYKRFYKKQSIINPAHSHFTLESYDFSKIYDPVYNNYRYNLSRDIKTLNKELLSNNKNRKHLIQTRSRNELTLVLKKNYSSLTDMHCFVITELVELYSNRNSKKNKQNKLKSLIQFLNERDPRIIFYLDNLNLTIIEENPSKYEILELKEFNDLIEYKLYS